MILVYSRAPVYSIFWVYMLNQILWMINIVRPACSTFPRICGIQDSHNSRRWIQVTLDELGGGFARSISAVLANRLMISVRRHYYGHEHDQKEATTMASTVEFQSAHTRATGTGDVMADLEADPSDATEATANVSDTTQAASVGGDDEYEMQNFSERAGF